MSSTNIINTLTNAPLPQLIEKLGLAIAQAQNALDQNSIDMANQMGTSTIEMGDGKKYSLLALGFAPTFYAFTEATIEAKLEFSLSESTATSVSGEAKVDVGVVAVSVSASYARKFELSAQGSSSIAARLVSIPAPENYQNLLKSISENAGQ